MGDGMLTQEEINMLLSGTISEGEDTNDANDAISSFTDDNINFDTDVNVDELLTVEEKDILGEIGNISMGTSATTLFTLLGEKVNITTPQVAAVTWRQLSKRYDRPCVGIRVNYKEGLMGANVLVLKESDVKIIANLMMGGDGVGVTGELTEIDLSAIGEAMNQMVGSSSTSISSMVNRKIDIDTPHAFLLDFKDDEFFESLGFGENPVICTSFRMEVGELIDSEIMQIFSVEFAKDMVQSLVNETSGTATSTPAATPQKPEASAPQTMPAQQMPQQMPQQMQMQQQMPQQMPMQQQMPQQMPMQQPYYDPAMQQQAFAQPQQYYQTQMPMQMPQQNVNVQPVQFQSFDVTSVMQQKENMGIIMDVPLEVTVELGRTHKLIREILEFSPGSIIELDKLSGEPIDIYVNGKFVAKGEVVVIDENFGIRISDIVSVENRI